MLRRPVVAVGLLLAGALMGCSSSGAGGDATSTSTASRFPSLTTVVADTTAAPADTRPVNADAQIRAVAAIVHDDDFSPSWTVYAPAAQVGSISQESCAYRPGGALTLIDQGGAQAGATMQLGTTGAFVSSYSFVFPDESLAREYIDLVNTDEWAACRGEQMQQFQDNHGIDSAVTLASRDDPKLHQDGFESFTEFELLDLDGHVLRTVVFNLYQVDRTVIGLTLEYGDLGDADEKTYFDESHGALLAAYNRVKAL